MDDEILAAVKSLDVNDDNLWTNKGQPDLETIRSMTKNPTLTRADIDRATSGYTRTSVQEPSDATDDADLSEVEALKVELETHTATLDDLDKQIVELRVKKDQANLARSNVVSRLRVIDPPETVNAKISAWQQSLLDHSRDRHAMAERINAVNYAAIPTIYPSPLDKAIADRNKHGVV